MKQHVQSCGAHEAVLAQACEGARTEHGAAATRMASTTKMVVPPPLRTRKSERIGLDTGGDVRKQSLQMLIVGLLHRHGCRKGSCQGGDGQHATRNEPRPPWSRRL